MPVSLVGKRIKYRYENGWEYHVYYESESRVSYDVVSGPFGSRHAYQEPRYAEVAPNVFMVGWYEETGTIVVQVVNLNSMRINSFAGFPNDLRQSPGIAREQRRQDGRDHEAAGEGAGCTSSYIL